MAREKCRYVSTSFWDDEWIQTLDPSEKLLYLYLLTNPLTSIAGIYKITVRRMCFDTGFNADTVGHILGKLEKAGKVFMFDGWLILPNWPKHQKVGKDDNNRKGIDSILKSLPDEVFQFIIQHGYTYQYIEALGRDIQAPYKPLTSPSDYINLNLNLNLNGNGNENMETPPAAQAPKAETSIAIQKPKTDPLYSKIKAAFEKVYGDFSDYAKEGAAIKRIIKLTKGDEPAVEIMVKTFYRLTQTSSKFWSEQPFLPSVLSAGSIWDRVKLEATKNQEHGKSWERIFAELEAKV